MSQSCPPVGQTTSPALEERSCRMSHRNEIVELPRTIAGVDTHKRIHVAVASMPWRQTPPDASADRGGSWSSWLGGALGIDGGVRHRRDRLLRCRRESSCFDRHPRVEVSLRPAKVDDRQERYDRCRAPPPVKSGIATDPEDCRRRRRDRDRQIKIARDHRRKSPQCRQHRAKSLTRL